MEVLLIYIVIMVLPILIGIISSIVSSIYYSLKLQKLRPKISSINLQAFESHFSAQVNKFNDLKQNVDSIKKLIDDKRDAKESIWYYISNDSNHQKMKTQLNPKSKTTRYRRY